MTCANQVSTQRFCSKEEGTYLLLLVGPSAKTKKFASLHCDVSVRQIAKPYPKSLVNGDGRFLPRCAAFSLPVSGNKFNLSRSNQHLNILQRNGALNDDPLI